MFIVLSIRMIEHLVTCILSEIFFTIRYKISFLSIVEKMALLISNRISKSSIFELAIRVYPISIVTDIPAFSAACLITSVTRLRWQESNPSQQARQIFVSELAFTQSSIAEARCFRAAAILSLNLLRSFVRLYSIWISKVGANNQSIGISRYLCGLVVAIA